MVIDVQNAILSILEIDKMERPQDFWPLPKHPKILAEVATFGPDLQY